LNIFPNISGSKWTESGFKHPRKANLGQNPGLLDCKIEVIFYGDFNAVEELAVNI